MDQPGRDFRQEAGLQVFLRIPVEGARSGAAQEQILLRPRDAYVAQAPLLFQFVVVRQAAGMREQTLFHAHEEHNGKLEALGRMERHEGDAVLVEVRVVDVRHQGDVFQEGSQGLFLTLFVHEILRHGLELFQVRRPAFRLGRALGQQLVEIARLVDDVGNQDFHGHLVHFAHELEEQRAELFQLRRRPGRDTRHLGGVRHDFKQAGVLRRRVVIQPGQGGGADSPFRHVEDALQAHRVVRVAKHLQVGHGIADFAAVVELDAADHGIGDAALVQDFLKDAGLGVEAVQHGHVAVVQPLPQQALGLFHDKPRLVALVLRLVIDDLLPFGILRPQLLGLAFRVVDDRVGRRQDRACGTVVLFQFQHQRVGIILLKVQDVADIRAAPAVNALVGVADDAQVAPLPREQPREQVLRAVCVLVFVDHDVRELVLVLFAHLRKLPQHFHGDQEQVIEVHGVVRPQPFLVFPVDLVNFLGMEIHGRLPERGGIPELVLGAGDGILHVRHGVTLLIQVQILQDALQQRLLVRRVVNGEVASVQARHFHLAAQDARAKGMECREPHVPGGRPSHVIHAGTHFFGRLVRKGDGQDLPGRDPLVQQMGNAAREHLGLAAAGAGQDEHGAFRMMYRFLLLRIQTCKTIHENLLFIYVPFYHIRDPGGRKFALTLSARRIAKRPPDTDGRKGTAAQSPWDGETAV